MLLNFSDLEFDSMGRPEQPTLLLQTMDDKPIGTLSGVYNLKFQINFSEPSEMTFDIPKVLDSGAENPLYDDVRGYRKIYTKAHGIYVIMSPEHSSDGIEDVKHITAYSMEKILEMKKFFIEEGTFKFGYGTTVGEDTLTGRIREIIPDWSFAVDSSIAQLYRTFDDYDDYLLDFMYNTAPEKYRCVFSFDVYNKIIYVYNADDERSNLPIYLDFNNLMTQLDIDEQSTELFTAMRPYGADDLDILEVNPIGSNWIYDLSYFIETGDIDSALATKWTNWQRVVLNQREYYRSIVALKASSTAQKITAQAKLIDLNGTRTGYVAEQSVTIQAIEISVSDEGRQHQQEVLDAINRNIRNIDAEIADQQAIIDSMDENIATYTAAIQSITSQYSFDNYFTTAEKTALSPYILEMDMTEETFVATDVSEDSGEVHDLSNCNIRVTNSTIEYMDLTDPYSKYMYTIQGGNFNITATVSGSATTISGDIIRGTVEITNNNKCVMSIYAGSTTNGNTTFESSTLTFSGTVGSVSSDVTQSGDLDLYTGTYITLLSCDGTLYFTSNVSEYQKYSVALELYDYAVRELAEVAWPTYEFSINSNNFLFAKEFEPFRDQLRLGECIYLKVSDNKVHTPVLLGVEFDYENWGSLTLTFSNRFRLHDPMNTFKDMLEKSYSASRSINANKYIYNRSVSQTNTVSKILASNLDCAKNTVLAAANQSVIIDGSGINVRGDGGDYQIRICDKMIAMTDDGWEHAKVAIGLVTSPDGSTNQFVVNADVLGGKLVITNNLLIENENDQGVMQFKVDASGAWLYNSTLVLQTDRTYTRDVHKGLMILDPAYGIVAGTDLMYNTSGTIITPEFMEDHDLVLDDDGIPEGASFFLDIVSGNAYFKGTIVANGGEIGGYTIADDMLSSGDGTSYIALNGSSGNQYAEYAIWCGANVPGRAPFWVKKDGSMCATDGTFRGTVQIKDLQTYNGTSMWNAQSNQIKEDYLEMNGISMRFNGQINGVYSAISANSTEIKTMVVNMNANTYSYISQTASSIRSEVGQNIATVNNTISNTANSITRTFSTEITNCYSAIQQNTSSIMLTVNSRTNSLSNSITTNYNTLNNKITSEVTVLSNKISECNSAISQTRNSISTTVKSYTDVMNTTITNHYNELGQLESSTTALSRRISTCESDITQLDNQIQSTVMESIEDIQDDVSTLTTNVSQVTQTASKINWLVSSGDTASNMTLTDRVYTLVAANIALKGYVTMSAVDTALADSTDTTIINGGELTTAKIYDPSKNFYMTMGYDRKSTTPYALELHWSSGYTSFAVSDDKLGNEYMYMYGMPVIYARSSASTIFPQSKWDFSLATSVTGIANYGSSAPSGSGTTGQLYFEYIS